MNEIPVFHDGRSRRGEGITWASSHPELVSGDLAIPPSRYASSAPMNRRVTYDRRRAIAGTLAMAALAALLLTVVFRSGAASADGNAGRQQLARTCMQWHLAASAVVSRMAQSTRDVDLVYVSNSIDRMRRARRNCELGEVEEACRGYHSVAAAVPGYAMTHELFACARVAVSDKRD